LSCILATVKFIFFKQTFRNVYKHVLMLPQQILYISINQGLD